MINAYDLIKKNIISRAVALRMLSVSAVIYLLWTFPGGAGGVVRVMRGEDAIEWRVVNVAGMRVPKCIQDAYVFDESDLCCGCDYFFDFYYDCYNGGRISYEAGQEMIEKHQEMLEIHQEMLEKILEIPQEMLKVRVLIKILWSLRKGYGREALEEREMSMWDAVQLLFEMQKYVERDLFLALMPNKHSVNQEGLSLGCHAASKWLT